MTGFEEDLRFVAYSIARFSSFAATAVIFGLVPVLLWVLRPAFAQLPDDEWGTGRRRIAERLEGVVQAVLAAATVATVVSLLLQATLVSELRREDIGSSSIFSVFETSFGRWYALRFPLLAALAIILTNRVRSVSMLGAGDDKPAPKPLFWWSWGLLGAGLLATQSFAGHASVAVPRSGAIVNDVIHLCAAATWFTGIIVLAVVLPDGWKGKGLEERLPLMAPAIVRFSDLALVSIAVVAITGTANSFLHVGSTHDIVDTGYGRMLAIKIGLFLLVLALGGINHFGVRRRLERAVTTPVPTWTQRVFRRAIAVELAVAVGLMAVTGVLVGMARTGPTENSTPVDDSVSSGSTP